MAWTSVGNIRGPKGDTGAPGANGEMWHYGTAAPSGGLGSQGDFYLRSTGDVYEKTTTSGWTLRINIMGAQGIQGPPGTPGSDASVTTASVRNVNGVIGTGLSDVRKLTRAQYDALSTKSSSTVYFISG